MPEPCRDKTISDRYRSQLITKDSFVDDFSCRTIKRSLATAFREGKAKKKAALEKGGKTKRDKEIEKDAKKLLWSFVGQQKWMLILGFPFMFLGSTIEFIAPHFIG